MPNFSETQSQLAGPAHPPSTKSRPNPRWNIAKGKVSPGGGMALKTPKIS
jgi:hypothetical protein